jgi:AraC-like DNA-binding protein
MGARQREPRFAVRLMRPFLQLLRNHPGVVPEIVQHYDAMDPEDRIPAATALRLLEASVEATGNPDLGLDAVGEVHPGDWDVLEYAANTCLTFSEGLEVTGRYIALINEAASYRLERTPTHGHFRIACEMPQCRASIDFQLASIHAAARHWRGNEMPRGIEIWFSYPQPRSIHRHVAVFEGCTLRFEAEYDAYVVPLVGLDKRLSNADPKLNQLLRRHADRLMSDLLEDEGFAGSVRRLILEGLPTGRASVELIAARLEMSRRTLLRKLDREGTTFKALLDETRRALALRYLESGQMTASDVALLLGFAQAAAFHRAFKRWTGETPLSYQRRVRHRPQADLRSTASVTPAPERDDAG